MATAKKGKRSTAPKKSAAKKRNPGKAPATSESSTIAAVRAEIEALDRRELPEKIRFSVSDVLFACKRLRKNALRLRGPLLAKSRLEAALLDAFGHRITVLEESEDAWDTLRRRSSPKSLNDARTSATKLRSEAVTSMRHFFAKDNELQVRLDEIMEGDGDADLIDDCKKLAPLVEARWSTLDGRSELPKEGADALRKAAAIIEEARIGNEPTPEAKAAMALRDKAYFHLLAAESEIRECGRHAFRSRPELAEVFADVLGARKRSAPSRAGGGGGNPPAK
jgi:hypothetical protein